MKNKSSEVDVEKNHWSLGIFSTVGCLCNCGFLRGVFILLLLICFIKIDLINIWLFVQFNFRGIVSSCFEPHLTVYVELEEKTLMDSLEKLVQVICVSPLRSCSVIYFWLFSLIKSSVYYRRRHGILRREVRVVYYPVACR
jgi:hypothetical protein